MIYRVEISPAAIAEADAAFEAIARWSSEAAHRWMDGPTLAVVSLEKMPRRFGYAREHDAVSYERRQFLFGSYRVLFTIVGQTVRVLHVRYAAMADIPSHELGR